MATDVIAPGSDEPGGDKPGSGAAASSGFFSIYKPKQGKPTRLATGAAAALLVGLTMWFLFHDFAAAFPVFKDAQGVNKPWRQGLRPLCLWG